MHRERYERPAAPTPSDAARRGGRVLAVGTTVAARAGDAPRAPGRLRGETDLFIHPGFRVPHGRPAAHQLPPAEVDAC